MRISDWSSDVCSSDLSPRGLPARSYRVHPVALEHVSGDATEPSNLALPKIAHSLADDANNHALRIVALGHRRHFGPAKLFERLDQIGGAMDMVLRKGYYGTSHDRSPCDRFRSGSGWKRQLDRKSTRLNSSH